MSMAHIKRTKDQLAQRVARDTETAAALAEDAVRRAKLDLLVALGRFPK